MLRSYLKIWEWEWIFGRAMKAISSPGVRSPSWWWLLCSIRNTLSCFNDKLSRKCEPPQCVHMKIHFSRSNRSDLQYISYGFSILDLTVFGLGLCIVGIFLLRIPNIYIKSGEIWIIKWTHCVPQCHIRPTRSANNNACHYIPSYVY